MNRELLSASTPQNASSTAHMLAVLRVVAEGADIPAHLRKIDAHADAPLGHESEWYLGIEVRRPVDRAGEVATRRQTTAYFLRRLLDDPAVGRRVAWFGYTGKFAGPTLAALWLYTNLADKARAEEMAAELNSQFEAANAFVVSGDDEQHWHICAENKAGKVADGKWLLDVLEAATNCGKSKGESAAIQTLPG